MSVPQQSLVLPKDEVTTTIRTNIQRADLMVSMIFDQQGFHIIGQLGTDTKINRPYSIPNIFRRLHQNFFRRGRNPFGKWL
jgi:hypothetical protein